MGLEAGGVEYDTREGIHVNDRLRTTNRRVFVRHGLVSIHEQTARLERVQDITLHQTLFDRMFGVGRLQIDTAGSSGGALEFKALLEPTEVREVLESAVRAEQRDDDV